MLASDGGLHCPLSATFISHTLLRRAGFVAHTHRDEGGTNPTARECQDFCCGGGQGGSSQHPLRMREPEENSTTGVLHLSHSSADGGEPYVKLLHLINLGCYVVLAVITCLDKVQNHF